MATGHSTCAVRIRGYIAFLGSALLFLALMAAVTLPAAAQSAPQSTQTADDPFAAAVQALDARKFSDKAKAIDALGVLGDERAIVVLQAFADGRLYRRKADKAVIIGDRDGGSSDAVVDRAAKDLELLHELTTEVSEKQCFNLPSYPITFSTEPLSSMSAD